MNCDICSGGTSLICSNCMNYALLKYRIQQIDTDYNSTKYVKEIDGILANCINHNAYDYIKSNGNESSNLATKLAQQLLNIEIIQLKKSLLMHKDKIDKLNLKNNALRSRVEEYRLKNGDLKKKIKEKKNEVNKRYETKRSTLRDEMNKNIAANKQVSKQVKSLQSKLSQELIELHDIVKKNDDQVYVSFVPIVRFNEYINYDYQLINANLLNVANFSIQSTSYSHSPLVFSVFYPTESVVFKINSKQKIFKFVEYNPIIRNRNECYPLYLLKNVYELNKYELGLFVKAMTCLILNLVMMIRNKNMNIDLSIDNLTNLGHLIWKFIGNNDDSQDRKESFLKMFWNLQKYKHYTTKVDLNLTITKQNEFPIFKPSKTINSKLISFEVLSSHLFKLIGTDIQQYRMDNKDKFKQPAGSGSNADHWEVV